MTLLQPDENVLDLFRALDGLHKAYWRLGVGFQWSDHQEPGTVLAGDFYRLASVTEEGSKAFQVLFAAAVFRMSEPIHGNERIQFSTNEIPGDRPPNQTNDKISPMSHDMKVHLRIW